MSQGLIKNICFSTIDNAADVPTAHQKYPLLSPQTCWKLRSH